MGCCVSMSYCVSLHQIRRAKKSLMSNNKDHPLDNQNNDNYGEPRSGDLLREYRQYQQYSPQSSAPLEDSQEPVVSSSSKKAAPPEHIKEFAPLGDAQKPLTPGEMQKNGTGGNAKEAEMP